MIKKIFIKNLKKNDGPFSPRKAKFIIWVARFIGVINNYKYRCMKHRINSTPLYIGFAPIFTSNMMVIINPENIPDFALNIIRKTLIYTIPETGIDIDGDLVTLNNDIKLYVNIFDGIIEKAN